VSPSNRVLLRELGSPIDLILGETHWGARGTVTVAMTRDLDSKEPFAIALFHEEGFVHRSRLQRSPLAVRYPAQAKVAASFADVDGDGRADILLRTEGVGASAELGVHTQVFLSPRSIQEARPEIEADAASSLAVLGSKSLDAAVRQAIQVPAAAVRAEAVRHLVAKGAPLPPRVLHYDEHVGLPGLIEVARADRAQWWTVRGACIDELPPSCDLVCDPERPICHSHWRSGETTLPYRGAYYWLTWNGGHVRLAAVAFNEDGSGVLF
jgi:hypothetical protein